MDSIVVRRPTASDRDELHSLFDCVIRRTFELEEVGDEFELKGELIADQQALIDAALDTDGSDICFLVAQCGGQIVGTVCHRPCSDIIRDCADRDTTGAHEIGSIYILPQFQSKGIARMLLNAMCRLMSAKGMGSFWLDSGYAIAKQVWRRILGRPTVIMKDYWAQGVDHHIWFRKLDEVVIGQRSDANEFLV